MEEFRVARIDLTKMSFEQLLDLEERLGLAISRRKVVEANEVKAKLEAVAQQAGFSLSELLDGTQRRVNGKGGIQYRNPKNPSQTWSGRGRRPLWLVDAVQRGAQLESFAV